jgi:hypothetical protein
MVIGDPNIGRVRRRTIRIGDGVEVEESDVSLVMEQASVCRGAAIRALRRYEGDVVDSILMLTNPDTMRTSPPPPPRDPMTTPSDDQATAWFLQHMFDHDGYHWNGCWDVRWRMGNGMRTHTHWLHEEFQVMEEKEKLDAGYNSA